MGRETSESFWPSFPRPLAEDSQSETLSLPGVEVDETAVLPVAKAQAAKAKAKAKAKVKAKPKSASNGHCKGPKAKVKQIKRPAAAHRAALPVLASDPSASVSQ